MIIFNILLIIVIAWIFGQERANSGKAIGFRSIALIMLASFAFTLTAMNEFGVIDYHVIAQIVTGVSFVGAGLIFKDNNVHNLTTAILVWASAAIGILIGLNLILKAIIISVFIFLILIYKK